MSEFDSEKGMLMQLFTNLVPAMTVARPMDASTGTTSDASSSGDSSSAMITANDFLQLLVTELQNQDPTANTDPNEYIDQLVQVNSLEQLIQINQNTTPSSSSTTATGDASQAAAKAAGAATPTSATVAPGNLSAPAGAGASSRIVDALGTAAQTLAPGSGSTSFNSLLSTLKARAQQAHTSLSNPAQ
jgi:flagellar basal-body rod modification protein FlgD